MSRFSQIRYNYRSKPPETGPRGLLARILAALVGIFVLGVSIFLGAIFIAAIAGLMLLGLIILAGRIWWLKRQAARYQAEHGDLEAEYTVVTEEINTIREQKEP